MPNCPKTFSILRNTFEFTPTGISKVVQGKEGPYQIPLTNFDARIQKRRTIIAGDVLTYEFDLQVTIDGHDKTVTVAVDELHKKDWIVRHLGVSAICASGRDAPDEIRLAIQSTASGTAEAIAVKCTG